MSNEEFFRRAQEDPAYRSRRLADQHYYRNVNLGLLVFSSILCLGMTAYNGFTGGGWTHGLEVTLPLVLLTGWMHSLYGTRIAALEAMTARDSAVLSTDSGAVTRTAG